MGERTLAGKRVAVVGASAGIGRAFAVRAGKEGADLLVAARRRDRLEEVVAEAGGGSPVTADVRRAEDCAHIAEVARDQLGGIDLLFISVGYAPLRMFADTSADDWLDVMQTNVISVHQVIRSVSAGACVRRDRQRAGVRNCGPAADRSRGIFR